MTDQPTPPVPAPQDRDDPAVPAAGPVAAPRARRSTRTATAGGASATGGSEERRQGLPAREGPARARRRSAGSTDAGAGSAAILEPDPEALALAHRIVDLAADKKAADIVLLDVRALTTVTDYFVLCSGGSERQLAAIGDGIVEGLKEASVLPLGREGGPYAHWVLLDYGFAVVHVMAQPERDYYALEKLWSDAPLLLRVL